MATDLYERRDKKAVGQRLALTRAALGLNQREFAERAGLGGSAYNQQENGNKLPGIETAHALCDHYELTLDWIYRGDNSNLPYALGTAIDALIRARR